MGDQEAIGKGETPRFDIHMIFSGKMGRKCMGNGQPAKEANPPQKVWLWLPRSLEGAVGRRGCVPGGHGRGSQLCQAPQGHSARMSRTTTSWHALSSQALEVWPKCIKHVAALMVSNLQYNTQDVGLLQHGWLATHVAYPHPCALH